MQIEELHLAANRAWNVQLARCLAVSLVLILVPLTQHWIVRVPAVASISYGEFAGFALIAIWMAEQTWRSWQSRKFIRALSTPLTVAAFRREKARERFQLARSTFFLFCGMCIVWSWALHGSLAGRGAYLISLLIVIPAAAVYHARRELRGVAA